MALAFSMSMSGTGVLDKVREINASISERRRERRLRVKVPGEITGIDRAGHLYMEHVTIEDVNGEGCRFDTSVRLEPGNIVAVKPLLLGEESAKDERPPQLLEVVWVKRHEAHWSVGAILLCGEKLVDLKFSPANHSPDCRPPK
jgi:hypothetical protein